LMVESNDVAGLADGDCADGVAWRIAAVATIEMRKTPRSEYRARNIQPPSVDR